MSNTVISATIHKYMKEHHCNFHREILSLSLLVLGLSKHWLCHSDRNRFTFRAGSVCSGFWFVGHCEWVSSWRSPTASCSCSASAALSVDKHSLDHFCNKQSSLIESVIMGTVLTLNHLNYYYVTGWHSDTVMCYIHSLKWRWNLVWPIRTEHWSSLVIFLRHVLKKALRPPAELQWMLNCCSQAEIMSQI